MKRVSMDDYDLVLVGNSYSCEGYWSHEDVHHEWFIAPVPASRYICDTPEDYKAALEELNAKEEQERLRREAREEAERFDESLRQQRRRIELERIADRQAAERSYMRQQLFERSAEHYAATERFKEWVRWQVRMMDSVKQ